MQGKSRAGIGYVLAVVQGVFYSTIGIFSKLIYATGLGPEEVVLIRFGMGSLIIGAFILLTRKHRLLARTPLTYVQGCCFFLSEWLYSLAVARMAAGLTTVIFYIYPAAVAVMGLFVFRERITAFLVGVIALTMVGMVFISGLLVPGSVVLDPLGMLFAFLSCLAFAAYSVIMQYVGDASGGELTTTFTVSIVAFALAALFLFPHLPVLTTLSLHQTALGLGTALCNAVLPVIIFAAATKRIGATKASLIGAIEAPCSLFLAWLILGEVLDAWQFVGSALIIAAVVLISAQPVLQERRKRAAGGGGAA